MKKFTKVVLYIVAGMALAGVICLGIGSLGHGFKKIGEFGLSGSDRVIKFCFLDENTSIFENSDEVGSGQVTEYSAEGLKNLDFDLGAGNFEILPSSDGKIRITNNTSLDIKTKMENATLYVGTDNKSSFTYNEKSKVKIEIPENIDYESVEYSFGAGQFEQNLDIKCKEYTLELGAGKAFIKGLTTDFICANLGAGEIEFNNAYTDNADFEVDMGTMNYQGDVYGSMELECSMGSVDMVLFSSEDEHNISYEIGAGSFGYGHRNYSGSGEYESYSEDVESNFEIACSMGTVNIDFNEAL